MTFRFAPWASLVLGAISASAFAVDGVAADDTTIVVIATRTPTRSSEILSDVTTISRAQIEQAGTDSLPELLASQPGIQVSTTGGPGAYGTLSLRGTNAAHALILIDGQRVSSATTGTTAIEHIPLEQIERIEILRGPASSLYGADAIGGVIQIFTRRGSGAPAPSFAVGAGRYDTRTASVAYGGDVGDRRFHLQAGVERSGGFSDIKAARVGQFDMYNPDNDAYDNRNLSAGVTQRLTPDLSLGADYLHVRGLKHFDAVNCDANYVLCTANFDNRLLQTLDSASVHVDFRPLDGWNASLRAGRSRDRMTDWQFDPASAIVTEPHYETRDDQISWQNDIAIGSGKLMAAVEGRGVHVDSSQPLVEHEQNTSAVILGYQERFGDHLIQASGRSDSISRLGRHNTGSLGYGYRFAENWVARGSIGTGFHSPTFNDLYWPLDTVNYYQGNPNLKPERDRNREIGVSYEAAAAAASASFYYNSVADLIDFVPGGAPTYIGTMGNVDSATLKGATLQYRRGVGDWDWKLSGDILSARDGGSGNVLQRRAPRTASIGIVRHMGRLDLSGEAKALSRRFNDPANTQTLGGYTLVDLSAIYHIGAHWTVNGRLSNLFDKDYVVVRSTLPPFNDYAVAGRALFVNLRYASN